MYLYYVFGMQLLLVINDHDFTVFLNTLGST